MSVVIIGASAAGLTAAQVLRANNSEQPVTIITEEPECGYARCLLPDVLAGEKELADIRWRGNDFYRENNLALMKGARVVSLDPYKRQVTLADGQAVGYDKLLVATGSRPVQPAEPGARAQGIFTLRTYGQTLAMARMAQQVGTAVVMGGGLVGLKAAWALRRLGVQRVTVLVKSPHLLMRQLDEESGAMLGQELQALGIDCVFGIGPQQYILAQTGDRVASVGLDDGSEIPADLVLVGKGVTPNVSPVREAGGAVGRGIQVDRYLQTTLPHVYAAGDCIEIADLLTRQVAPSGLWPLAVEQGRCAALNMLGQGRAYSRAYPPPLTRFNAAQFGGLPLVSVGHVDRGANTSDAGEYQVYVSRLDNAYRKLVFKNDYLMGFIMLGEIGLAGVYHGVVKRAAPVPLTLKNKLIDGTVCVADVMRIS